MNKFKEILIEFYNEEYDQQHTTDVPEFEGDAMRKAINTLEVLGICKEGKNV